MAKETNLLKPAETATAKPSQKLPETKFLRLVDTKQRSIISINNHPLRNSIPFGGSFGYYESDDKW